MGSGVKVSRVFGAAVSLVTLLLGQVALADTCREDHVDLRGSWGEAGFAIELADTPETRAQGLMNRESMDRWAGMLFIYPEPKPVAFWMKDTLIPLDMLFIDDKGVVVGIHERAQPMDERPIFGGDQIKAVLEINGGMAETLGMEAGTELRHPALTSAEAAWPCGGVPAQD